ncbi:MAG: hypothetical protein LBD30_00165 [Verrucomicrobiales bacterium]|jgi:nucleoside-diphosphate-sugar epimerase|nr:hypothetical protein [Verrucomicrobiales bacterium]
MSLDRILITGGCGFVGSTIALHFREKLPRARVVALDNFHRHGSELNAERLRENGVEVLRGGARLRGDLAASPAAELLVECSAEPSVPAGYGGGPACSLSLLEATALCRQTTGNEIPVGVDGTPRPMDIPWHVTDNGRLFARTGWRPRRDAAATLADTRQWIRTHEARQADKFFI